jgi:cardiolipin synthase
LTLCEYLGIIIKGVCFRQKSGKLKGGNAMNKKDILTIPNLLSVFRIFLIPVYVYIYLHADKPSDYWLAAGILAVSSLTDMLDGIIARKCNMISKTGKILDPIADKATQGILMICLALRYDNMWILFAFFVIKEGFMAVMGIINLKKGKMLNGAKFSGKVCTTVLFVCMILLILFPKMQSHAVNSLIIISAFFMVISLVSYFVAYFKRSNELVNIRKERS